MGTQIHLAEKLIGNCVIPKEKKNFKLKDYLTTVSTIQQAIVGKRYPQIHMIEWNNNEFINDQAIIHCSLLYVYKGENIIECKFIRKTMILSLNYSFIPSYHP